MRKPTKQETGKLIGSVLNLATVILRTYHDKLVNQRISQLEQRVVALEMTSEYRES